MAITRRNLLHGFATAGTVLAADSRPLEALVSSRENLPLAAGPVLLNRNENAYDLLKKCRPPFAKLLRSAVGTRVANTMLCEGSSRTFTM